jgi:hypothetical protein
LRQSHSIFFEASLGCASISLPSFALGIGSGDAAGEDAATSRRSRQAASASHEMAVRRPIACAIGPS